MKRLLALSLALTSFSALSQPTLLTEIKSGDNWVRGDFSKLSVDRKKNGYKFVSDIDSYGFDSIFVSSDNNNFSPFIGFGAGRASEEDEKVIVKSAFTGGVFTLEEGRAAFFSASYNKSSNTDWIRDHARGTLAFQMSDVGDSIKHQLSLSGTYFKKADDVRGGHSFDISNSSKITFGSKLDLVVNVGAEISSELKLDQDYYRDYDSSFSYGFDLNVHPAKQFTMQISIQNTSEDGQDSVQNVSTKFSQDITLTSISILSRF